MSGNNRDANQAYAGYVMETDGSLMWIRDWKLSVGTSSGETAIDLSNLAFSFSVEEVQFTAAYQATFTIYNVDDDMAHRFEKELTQVYFEAGYTKPSHQYGKLFTGPITYFRHGRQSATDTFVEIHAMSPAEGPFNKAVVNTTLPAGHTQKDVLNALVAVLAPYGIGLGQVTDLGDAASPRGRLLYGNVSDVLRDLAQTHNANAFLDRDSKLHVLKEGESLDTHAEAVPVLNSKTGMIGVPTQTMSGGVEVRSLLNPSITPGGRIKLDQKAITQYTVVSEALLPQTLRSILFAQQSIHADGFYVVQAVKHYGESRGNAWYSDITTQGIDPTQMKPSTGLE